MSWDIILFNTKQKIDLIEEIDEEQFEPIDFTQILESSFTDIVKDDNHREIKGKDFSIDFFTDGELVSNKMISLYGENGLFELIELAKKHGWQIFDTGLGEMIDLDNPEKNGYENHRKYVEQIMKIDKNGVQQCIKNISGSVVYETFVHIISSAKSAI